MFTRPASAEQCLHNALCVISAMTAAGIDYDIQVWDHTAYFTIQVCYLYVS